MKKNLSYQLTGKFYTRDWRALSCVGLVATAMATIFLMGCQDPIIQSTRFGVIESASFGSSRIFLIKDEITKKQYMLCNNCTITEYKGKK